MWRHETEHRLRAEALERKNTKKLKAKLWVSLIFKSWKSPEPQQRERSCPKRNRVEQSCGGQGKREQG